MSASKFTPRQVKCEKCGNEQETPDERDAMKRAVTLLDDLIHTYMKLIRVDNEVRDLMGYIAVAFPEKKHLCNETREVVVRKFIAEYANYIPELSDVLDRLKADFGIKDVSFKSDIRRSEAS